MSNEPDEVLRASLSAIIENAPCQCSVVVGDFTGRVIFEWNADSRVPSASVAKLPILVALLKLAQGSELDLSSTVRLPGSQNVVGSGVLGRFKHPCTVSLFDLASLMMCVSDNLATNIILEAITLPKLDKIISSLGLGSIKVSNFLEPSVTSNPSTFAEGTARSYFKLMKKLKFASLLDETHTSIFWNLVGDLRYSEPLRRNLPFNPYWRELKQDPDLRIYGKTGALPGIRAGVGVYETRKNQWCISTFMTDLKDLNSSVDNIGFRLISEIARKAYEALA